MADGDNLISESKALKDMVERIRKNTGRIQREAFSTEAWKMDDMLVIFETIGKAYTDTFVIDRSNKGCYVNLIKWLLADPSFMALNPITHRPMKGRLAKGLYISGPTGTGKTLALRILAHMSYSIGVRYKKEGEQPRLFAWMDKRADEIADMYSHGDSLDSLKREAILCIQDLGCEPPESIYMGNRVNVLRNILEQRGDRLGCMTLITSNLPLDSQELRDKYGDRAVSRLMEMCNFIVLKGEDHRQKF